MLLSSLAVFQKQKCIAADQQNSRFSDKRTHNFIHATPATCDQLIYYDNGTGCLWPMQYNVLQTVAIALTNDNQHTSYHHTGNACTLADCHRYHLVVVIKGSLRVSVSTYSWHSLKISVGEYLCLIRCVSTHCTSLFFYFAQARLTMLQASA